MENSCEVSFFTGEPRVVLELANYIEKIVDDGGVPKFKCTICGSTKSQKSHVENHITDIHCPGSFQYTCSYCGLSFDKRNKMYKHRKLCQEKQFAYKIEPLKFNRQYF